MAPTMTAFEAHLYECHACGKDCNSKGGLTTHLKHCRKIVFTCAECNEVFHSKAALDGHRKKHTKDEMLADSFAGIMGTSTKHLYGEQHRRQCSSTGAYNKVSEAGGLRRAKLALGKYTSWVFPLKASSKRKRK